jgi:hypothetical protein
MAKLYNVKTRQAETLPVEQVEDAILSGTHSYRVKDRVDVLDDQGKSWNAPATELKSLLQSGYKLESPDQAAVREYVKENKGLKGAAKVALGQFADEALMGLPEIIASKTQDPLEVAKRDALKKEHSAANTIGGVGGFAASLLYGGPVGKLATTASKAGVKAAEKVVAQRLVTSGIDKGSKAMASEIAKKIAQKSTQYGVEGAVFAAPKAITEAALGDPELAAETLLFSTGAGMGLGMGGAAFKEISKITGRKIKEGIEGTAEFALNKFGGVDPSMSRLLSKDLGDSAQTQIRQSLISKDKKGFLKAVEDAVEETAKPMFKNPTFMAKLDNVYNKAQESLSKNQSSNIMDDVTQIFALEHFIPGAGALVAVGKGAKKALDVATTPSQVVQGLLYAEKAMKATAKTLDKIPEVLGNMAKGANIKPTSSVGAMASFLGQSANDMTREEQIKELGNKLSEYNSNPDYAIGKTSPISTALSSSGAPMVGDAYSRLNVLAAKYLQDHIPKPSRMPSPFVKQNWKPSDQEISAFERRVHAVNNPLSIIDDIGAGTLSREAVDAVKTIYPRLYANIQQRVMDQLIENPQEMGYNNRLKLSRLLDLPLGNEFQPQNIVKLQLNFEADDSQSPALKPTKLPEIASDIQKLNN